jgi:hypothetical protein
LHVAPSQVSNILTLIDGKTFLAAARRGGIVPAIAPDVALFREDTCRCSSVTSAENFMANINRTVVRPNSVGFYCAGSKVCRAERRLKWNLDWEPRKPFCAIPHAISPGMDKKSAPVVQGALNTTGAQAKEDQALRKI